MIDQQDHDPASALVRALAASGSARELRDEEAAVAAFRHATAGPARAGRGRLRLASGIGATAVASAFVMSATVVTAAAYTAALPHDAQRAAHHLLHRLGVPGPTEHASRPKPTGTATALLGRPVPQRQQANRAPRRSPYRPQTDAGRPHIEVRVDQPVVLVGASVRIEIQEQGALLPGSTSVVQVQDRSPGSPTWSVLRRAPLRAGGDVTVVLAHVQHSLEIRVVLAIGHGRALVSAQRELHARPQLSLRPGGTTSGAIPVTVRTNANQQGRVVVLQEQVAGAWRNLSRATVGADGSALFRVPASHGRQLLRATMGGSALFDPAVSTNLAVDAP